ncbi:MAG: methyltransferase domain-containing protein [Oscillospiraceae bacterium]|nr:methyltransferase domain-containing protein [Oscillospiraceae bacterium]
MDARSAALSALGKCRRSGAGLDKSLEALGKKLSGCDRSLALQLCYGTVQNSSLIDLALKEQVNFRKTQPQILDILRLGVYQIWFTDRIPLYAIVNESVKSARKTAPHAARLVNAVLRKIPGTPPVTDDICTRYSMPIWLHQRLLGFMPENEVDKFFAASNTVPPLYFQKNPLRRDPLPQRMNPHPKLEGCYLGNTPENLPQLIGRGQGIVADPAARLAVLALDPKPGMRIWDCCAAPGGKSLMAGMAMENKGVVYATDIAADKLCKIRNGASALGLSNIRVAQADARTEQPQDKFDAVICDVPCSGFGVLRKKPDIRFKTPEKIAPLPELQLSILKNASKVLRPGGLLLYSTCTIFPDENSGVVYAFLEQNTDFSPRQFSIPIAGKCLDGYVSLFPHKHDTDGFFICLMQKGS